MPFEEADFTREVELLESEEQVQAPRATDPTNSRKAVEVVILIVLVIFAIAFFALLLGTR